MVAILERYVFPEKEEAMVDALAQNSDAPAGNPDGHEMHDLETREGSGGTGHQPPSQPVTPTHGAE